jgi:hypothetical protein
MAKIKRKLALLHLSEPAMIYVAVSRERNRALFKSVRWVAEENDYFGDKK